MTEDITQVILPEATKEIFKDKKTEDVATGGVDIFSYLTKAGEVVAPWWSKRRDEQLRKVVKGNDNLSSAQYVFASRLTSTPVRVEPKDQTITSHVEQAAIYNEILLRETISRSDKTRKGWEFGFNLFLQDLTGQDNGGCFVIEGPGRPDGPLTGRPTKLIHLDSWHVTRTSNPEYPIVYEEDGKKYKIHYTRAIMISSLPSTIYSMRGVGLCAVSRCIHVSQILLDQLVYKEEKLGSRPKERIIIGKRGVTAEDIAKAFYAADVKMDAEGLTRYSKTVVLAPNVRSTSAEIDLDIQDLVDAGTIFDEKTSTDLGMYTISLAFGVPARWFWPATSTGATKADAEMQHLAGLVQGPGEILRSIKMALENKFLPPHLMISFDYQDDEQDRQQADIRKTRADQRKTDLESTVITVRVAREQALSSDDITQEQFDAMELSDGRLPNGDSLLAAFSRKKDAQLAELLDLGIENPLAVDENDPIDMLILIDDRAMLAQELTQEAPSAPLKRKARIALSALGELKKLYEQQATDEAVEQIKSELQQQQPTVEQPQQPPQQPQEFEGQTEAQEERPEEKPFGERPEEMGAKEFNFGARAGEIIGGGLARDVQGRFISAAQLGAEAQTRIRTQISSRKGEEQWEAVESELGLMAGSIDALSTLALGGVPDDGTVSDDLVARGLAVIDADGRIRISAAGAGVLTAANRGDAQRAQGALSRAGVGEPGKAGAAAKPDKEQVEADNREKIADSVDLPEGAIESLNDFSDGKELDSESLNILAQNGLVEFDAQGNPRLTSNGRALNSASNKGDVRKAKDALSKAKERLADTQEKIDGLREKESDTREDIAELETESESLQSDITALTERLEEETDERNRAKFQTRIDSLQKKLDRTQDQIQKKTSQADKIKRQADELTAKIQGTQEPKTQEMEVERQEPQGTQRQQGTERRQEERTEVDRILDEIAKLRGDGSQDDIQRFLELQRQLEEARKDFPIKKKTLAQRTKELTRNMLIAFEIKATESDYKRGLRAAVRGFWSGVMDRNSFIDSMVVSIERNLRAAFISGAAKAGIKEDELTEEEIKAMEEFIANQINRVPAFADAIEANRKGTGKLTPLLTRVNLWVNQFPAIFEKAYSMAGKNLKLKWLYNPEKMHCGDCANYNGRVYRAKTWAKYSIHPRMWHLECKGLLCGCIFEETDESVTPGRPPSPSG